MNDVGVKRLALHVLFSSLRGPLCAGEAFSLKAARPRGAPPFTPSTHVRSSRGCPGGLVIRCWLAPKGGLVRLPQTAMCAFRSTCRVSCNGVSADAVHAWKHLSTGKGRPYSAETISVSWATVEPDACSSLLLQSIGNIDICTSIILIYMESKRCVQPLPVCPGIV